MSKIYTLTCDVCGASHEHAYEELKANTGYKTVGMVLIDGVGTERALADVCPKCVAIIRASVQPWIREVAAVRRQQQQEEY